VPAQATADRGYGEGAVDRELEQLGVQTRSSRARDNPARPTKPVEHSPGFRELVKWRTGSEGRISHLKRHYG
jgi:transposase, IS5 family